jgi:flagellar motor switch protein FliN/FliY
MNPGDRRRDLLMNVSLELSAQIGGTSMRVRDLLDLGAGSILRLDRRVDEPVDVFANGKLIARGEIVALDDRFGVRITDLAP